MLNRRGGLAMAEQLDRVNKPDDPAALAAKLQAEIQTLNRLLEKARQERDYWREQANSGVHAHLPAGINAAGRVLVTPAEYARQIGKSVSTVNRALNGWGNYSLEGKKLDNGRWMVYADAPLIHRRKSKKS